MRIVVAAAILASLLGSGARATEGEIHYAPIENLERIDVELLRTADRSFPSGVGRRSSILSRPNA
jgi:hypothetical protein